MPSPSQLLSFACLLASSAIVLAQNPHDTETSLQQANIAFHAGYAAASNGDLDTARRATGPPGRRGPQRIGSGALQAGRLRSRHLRTRNSAATEIGGPRSSGEPGSRVHAGRRVPKVAADLRAHGE